MILQDKITRRKFLLSGGAVVAAGAVGIAAYEATSTSPVPLRRATIGGFEIWLEEITGKSPLSTASTVSTVSTAENSNNGYNSSPASQRGGSQGGGSQREGSQGGNHQGGGSQKASNQGSNSIGGSHIEGRSIILRAAHKDNPHLILFETAPDGNFLQALSGKETCLDESGGSFYVSATTVDTTGTVLVDGIYPGSSPNTIMIKGVLLATKNSTSKNDMIPGGSNQSKISDNSSKNVPFQIDVSEPEINQLRFAVKLQVPKGSKYNRLALICSSTADEAVFGFGEQLTYCNMKGQVIPIISQEHGIGRGLPGVSKAINEFLPGAAGTPVSTETASSYYMTSKGRSLALEGTWYTSVDLGQSNTIRIDQYSTDLAWRVFAGSDPLQILETATSYLGRLRPLPSWTQQGVILGMEGGTAIALQAITTAESNGVPIAGLWLQDWEGSRTSIIGTQLWWNWELDTTLYPNWNSIVTKLNSKGAKVLTYINPYLCAQPGHDSLYQEAKKKGYLVLNNDGSPYYIANSDLPTGVVDLSNPQARDWLKEVILHMVRTTGAYGWMADFGEGLPMEGVRIHSGNPAEFHNEYPVVWAEVNRDAIDSLPDSTEYLPFNRSGFTKSPGHMSLGWLGDQLQSWDGYDGIKTAVAGMLSGGMSGFSFLHSDIGGYDSLPPLLGGSKRLFTRTPELLMRWMELGALSPVMRTHEGLAPAQNIQWNSSQELIDQLKQCVKIYLAWKDYRKILIGEATEHGWPVTRHLFLHYPDDPNVYNLRYQYLLGSELLAAPVLDPGITSVRAYLPAGKWELLWTGETFGSTARGDWYEVPAPIGRPALLGKVGSPISTQIANALRQ